MSEELKPCPFCSDPEPYLDGVGACFHIVCGNPDCAASGPREMSEGCAIAAWNSRPALKDRDVVLEEAAERAAFVAGYRAAHMVPDAYDSTSAAEEAWEGYRLVSRALKERV